MHEYAVGHTCEYNEWIACAIRAMRVMMTGVEEVTQKKKHLKLRTGNEWCDRSLVKRNKYEARKCNIERK